MISMCALAGAGGLAEGMVVSGVWVLAGANVNSATGRPSDSPSATRSHVLIGFLLCGEAFIRIELGACPSCARPDHPMRTGAAVALRDFDPPDVAGVSNRRAGRFMAGGHLRWGTAFACRLPPSNRGWCCGASRRIFRRRLMGHFYLRQFIRSTR